MKIEFDGRVHQALERESVLDALLRAGVNVPHACKAGACGSCLMKIVSGTIPSGAQTGLKEAWKAQGYVLACVCRPEGDVALELPGAELRLRARIASLDWLSGDVRRVRLACEAALDFRAGQYVTLSRHDGLTRSYSIASLPHEDHLELHVRRIAGGRMSGWLASEAAQGDRVELRGPAGDCFYVPGRDSQPLLLVGTGTGLAPLYGIVRDALARGHQGPIHLFHGALRPEGLYLRDALESLSAAAPNLRYTPTVLEGEEEGVTTGKIDQVVLGLYPQLDGWRGFLCGDPALVQGMKKKCFLAGMALSDIHADAFLPSA